MVFDAGAYGSEVESILALDGAGQRLMPLASGRCSSKEALARLKKSTAENLFADSKSPEGALSGLYLYFSCLDESHTISQDISSPEGSYWHGIMHRQEPDAGNASYWFRSVGTHPLFPALREAAASVARRYPDARILVPLRWDPFAFIDTCEKARCAPGSPLEHAALEIQRVEWQLLFDYCARRERASR